MSTSSKLVAPDFEFLDELVGDEARPYVTPSPRLSLHRQGRSVGHIYYEVLDGQAKIFGAKLADEVARESRVETLEAIIRELGRRTGTVRPILSIRKSRWPVADLWPLLKAKDIVEIPAEAEAT